MTKMLKELPEREETETLDGITVTTKYFKVSTETRDAFDLYGGNTLPMYGFECPMLMVTANVEDGQWNGMNWLHDEMLEVGLNPADYGL